VTGDGRADVITGPGGWGLQPLLKVYDGATGAVAGEWMAYNPSFKGGMFVAAGDVDGDGRAEVFTGAVSGAPHVKVFRAPGGTVLAEIMAYGLDHTNTAYVAAADVDGDGKSEVVTGPGGGSKGPLVRVFDGLTLAARSEFLAFADYTGGASVG
jgi:hypothetical protein